MDDTSTDNHYNKDQMAGYKGIHSIQENTKKILNNVDVNLYSSFISAQNKYNSGQGMEEEINETKVYTPKSTEDVHNIVSDLTYINYRHNRQISPHVTPERWEKVYGPSTKMMEFQYQRELANKGLKEGIFDTHTTHGEDENLDPHAAKAAFGGSLSKIRDELGHKWDLQIQHAHGNRTTGQNPTKLGRFFNHPSKPMKTTGALSGVLTHKSDPSHKIGFVLKRDGGKTHVHSFVHNKSQTGGNNVSVDHMINHINNMSNDAQHYQGLTEEDSHEDIKWNLTSGSIDDGVTGHGFRQALKKGYSKEKIISMLRSSRGHSPSEIYDILDLAERPIKGKTLLGKPYQYLKQHLNIGIVTHKLKKEHELPDEHTQTPEQWTEKHKRLYGH